MEEDIDDFLEKVNRISNEIKGLANGTVSLEQVEATANKEEEKLKLEEKISQMKEQERKEKVEKGVPGKGNSTGYFRFCKYCFVEYYIDKMNCFHCGKETISRDERMKELKGKVEDYKKKKSDKETRKKKWENWRKTEAIFWKKTSTNYSKWDYFTSSSEEEDENAEPILPKNDPNFLALEKDVEERSKRRKADRKAATSLKEEGNEYMKKRDYIKAIEYYSLALEKVKDMKELYTNRALAYLKVGNYEKVVEDCSKVLEFTEVFEDGYEKSPDACFKAFIRRAQAYKELKQLNEGLQDLEQALKLFPNDADATRMKKEFATLKEHLSKSAEFKKDEDEKSATSEKTPEKMIKSEGVKLIDDFLKLESPSAVEIQVMVDVFKIFSELKVYAFEKGLIKKIANLLLNGVFDRKLYLLIIVFLQDNSLYLDEFFKASGPQHLIKKLKSIALALKDDISKKDDLFLDIEELYEVFINFTEQEKGRVWLKNAAYLENLVDELYKPIVQNISEQKEAATSFFSLISNLSVVSDDFRNFIEKKYLKSLIDDVMTVIFKKIKSSKYNRLRENIFGLLANLVHLDTTRKKFLDDTEESNKLFNYIIQSLDNYSVLDMQNIKWIKSVESILAFFINLAVNINEDIKKSIFIERLKLHEKFIRFFNLDVNSLHYRQINFRLIQLFSRLPVTQNFIKETAKIFKKQFEYQFSSTSKENGFTSNMIRLYIRIFSKENSDMTTLYNIDDISQLSKLLSKTLNEGNDERFINGSILAGNLIEIFEGVSPLYEGNIATLIEICKNKTGMVRKNGAIFLAKLSRNQSNLEKIRSLHGIELLYNISQFILN